MGWGGGGKKGGEKGFEKGGKGKWGKDDWYSVPSAAAAPAQADDGEELIWNAVTEMVTPILKMEKELDQNKLEKRIRDAFRKGAKGMAFSSKPWHELINEYADTAFSSIFSSLGDREWISQCDFLLCLDAGVKDNFPKELLAKVPPLEFEQVVLAAHDRSFELNRIGPIMWEVVTGTVDGPKGKKKVNLATDEAWKEAHAASCENGPDAQEFVRHFIDGTIKRIADASQGEPSWVLEPKLAKQMFNEMLQGGVMPWNIVNEHGPPPARWGWIGQCVEQAYQDHAVVNEYITKKEQKAMRAAAQEAEAMGMGYGKDGGKGAMYGKGMKGKGPYDMFGGKGKGKDFDNPYLSAGYGAAFKGKGKFKGKEPF